MHVYAVVLAHHHLSRAGETPSLRLRSEYPWLVAMVGYTRLSLWLLAQPLTEATSTTPGSLPPPRMPAVSTTAADGLMSAG